MLSSHLNYINCQNQQLLSQSQHHKQHHLFIMKNITRILHHFSKMKESTTLMYFNNLHKLEQKIQRQYFFIRKNYKPISEEIQYLIQSQQWNILNKGLRIVKINQIDSWLALRKISNKLNKKLNYGLDLGKLCEIDVENIVSVMNRLQYQPISQQHYNREGQYPYNRCQNLVNKLQQYIEAQGNLQIDEHYVFLARKLIHTHSYMFQKRREQFQQYLYQNVDKLFRMKFLMAQLLMKGAISHFWTQQFKEKMVDYGQIYNLEQQITPLIFQNTKHPTTIQKQKVKTQHKIQKQISNILEGYHYNLQSNLFINGQQIDILLADNVIVQFNGYHHYAINSDKLVPNVKQQWKINVLKKRGFAVCTIPYSQYKFIKHFSDKKIFLVNKIEESIIQQQNILTP